MANPSEWTDAEIEAEVFAIATDEPQRVRACDAHKVIAEWDRRRGVKPPTIEDFRISRNWLEVEGDIVRVKSEADKVESDIRRIEASIKNGARRAPRSFQP